MSILRNTRKMIACSAIVSFYAASAVAANIFEDSFDYGDSTSGINGVGGWSSSSTVLKYDHDGGLEHAQLSGETGGAMWLDYTETRAATHSISPSFVLTTLGAGDSVWIAALFQYVTGNTTHSLSLSGGAVSGMGIAVNSGGNVSVTATLNTTVQKSNATSITLGSGTYLMLLCYTKGTGTSPVDSQVDLWIDPADTSSEGALGAADWTLDSGDGQVKWGRDTDTLTSITAQPSQQGRIDEIRIGTVLSEVTKQETSASGTMFIFQ